MVDFSGLVNGLGEYSDAFDNLLVRQTRNNADLAAHYRYTPERHRFYRNGDRVLLQYEDIDAYQYFDDRRTGEEDAWILQPAAGDTLKFKSAERFRYTVNFVSEVTQALAISEPLTNADDRATWGLDTSREQDLSAGYFVEHLPDHADDEVDVFARRYGSVIGERDTVTLPVPLTTFQRWENDYNWYNVGVSIWRQTYTRIRDAIREQVNKVVSTLSTQPGDANAGPGGRGPESGNGHIVFEIEADASTTGLELYAGSLSFTTLGAVAGSIKDKSAEATGLSVSQTDTWVPLFAMRRRPGRDLVNTDLQQVAVTAGQGKCLVVACDPSNVLDVDGNELTDVDFSSPPEMSDLNSVVEVTDGSTVEQFPDSTGATVTSTDDPGGYQLQFDTSRQSGQGSTAETRSGDLEQKHGILDGDYAVVLANPQTTDNYATAYTIEMDE